MNGEIYSKHASCGIKIQRQGPSNYHDLLMSESISFSISGKLTAHAMQKEKGNTFVGYWIHASARVSPDSWAQPKGSWVWGLLGPHPKGVGCGSSSKKKKKVISLILSDNGREHC